VTRGLVLGKFLPPHAGHVYLIETARRLCDELFVVVGTLAAEPIPGALRARWMRAMFPDLAVLHLTDENPQDPSQHPRFWEIWRDSLLGILPAPPDLVFTSDAYGGPLADVLGARWVPVDPARAAVPVSGSAIRANPHLHWRHLPGPVRAHHARRISVFGPESTGKSTLAAALADALGTVCVPEYARSYLEARGVTTPTRADLDAIAAGQSATEDALAPACNVALICDTDPLLTAVWCETLFDAPMPLPPRGYDLTLLCDVDLPWVADPVRYLPHDRAGFFDRCAAALRAADRRYLVIRGPDRLAQALEALTPGPPRERRRSVQVGSTWWKDLYDERVAALLLDAVDDAESEATADFLVERLRLRPGDRVLDQCAGTGRLAAPLAARGLAVVAIEQSAAYVARIRARAPAVEGGAPPP
jgi:HTH-type transcriptional repressor of NAD biosynthesis genes